MYRLIVLLFVLAGILPSPGPCAEITNPIPIGKESLPSRFSRIVLSLSAVLFFWKVLRNIRIWMATAWPRYSCPGAVGINKMKSWFVIIFVAFVWGVGAAASAETYVYETQKVALTGMLTEKIFYGPPGYGEDPKHDKKEKAYVIKLSKKITVVPPEGDKTNERHDNVSEVQVVNTKQLPLKTWLQKRITVKGTLFSAISGHHHTEVLINADAVSPAD